SNCHACRYKLGPNTVHACSIPRRKEADLLAELQRRQEEHAAADTTGHQSRPRTRNVAELPTSHTASTSPQHTGESQTCTADGAAQIHQPSEPPVNNCQSGASTMSNPDSPAEAGPNSPPAAENATEISTHDAMPPHPENALPETEKSTDEGWQLATKIFRPRR
ncbi:Protein of unknown function, partial [Gryllus bimaculatus]